MNGMFFTCLSHGLRKDRHAYDDHVEMYLPLPQTSSYQGRDKPPFVCADLLFLESLLSYIYIYVQPNACTPIARPEGVSLGYRIVFVLQGNFIIIVNGKDHITIRVSSNSSISAMSIFALCPSDLVAILLLSVYHHVILPVFVSPLSPDPTWSIPMLTSKRVIRQGEILLTNGKSRKMGGMGVEFGKQDMKLRLIAADIIMTGEWPALQASMMP